MLCVGIFVLGMIALQAALKAFYAHDFASRDIVLWSLIMVVAGAILAAYDRIVIGGVLPAAPGSAGATVETPVTSASASATVHAVRLSPREQEVLQLVSEGYSNSMIAGRLHLSENTIKTYVENLLTRLNARNRAEAVAAASRQNLI
jgi:DNA-binding NarL/FixJ family response regulator